MKIIVNLSGYIMLQALISTFVWSLFFFFIEKLGERPLAIATIARSFYIFMYVPIGAYGTAVNSTVSAMIGEGKSEYVTPYLKMVRGVSFVTMAVLSLFLFLFPSFFLGLFSDDPILVQESVPTLYVICLSLLVTSVANIYFNAVFGTGATKMAFIIEMASTLGYVLYSAVMTLALHAPVHICYTVEIFYYIGIGWMSYTFLRSGRWQSPRWSTLR